MWRVLLVTVSFSFAFSLEALGQVSTGSVPQNNHLPALYNLRGISEDYRVGIGDTVEIQVVDQPKLNQTVKVSSSGDIDFPYIGPVQVVDLTAAELEAKIASQLQEKKLLQQPEVLVYVREFQAKKVFATGEIASPGELIMTQQLTVTDALLLSGGLTLTSDRYGYIHRRVSGEVVEAPPPASVAENPEVAGPGVEIIKFDLQPLKEGGVLENDIPLRGGDVLIVPRRKINLFFVMGEVIQPRNFVLPTDKVILASQAISWAGGPSKTAKMSQGMLVRYDKDGNRQELQVDYNALMKGEQEDYVIQPNDVIFIPGSKAKEIGQAFVGMTDAMIMQQLFKVGRQMQLPQAPEPHSVHSNQQLE